MISARAAILTLVGLSLQPCVAHAQPASGDMSTLSWNTFRSPDGKISVDLPCAPADLKVRSKKQGFSVECKKLTISLNIWQGIGFADYDDSPEPGFRGRLIRAQHSGGGDRLQNFRVSGHRAFASSECKLGLVQCEVVVDDAPQAPVIFFAGRQIVAGTASDDFASIERAIILRASGSVRLIK